MSSFIPSVVVAPNCRDRHCLKKQHCCCSGDTTARRQRHLSNYFRFLPPQPLFLVYQTVNSSKLAPGGGNSCRLNLRMAPRQTLSTASQEAGSAANCQHSAAAVMRITNKRKPQPVTRLGFSSREVFLALEQGQNTLRQRVGLGQHGHTGLLKNLRLGQVGSLGSKVSVLDT